MGLTLPNAGKVFIPEIPKGIDPATANFLRDLKRGVERAVQEQFSNSLYIATAMNLGTSGTFTISSGGSIIITSGIVIKVTS